MFFLADEFNAELQTGERGRSLVLRKAREILMSLVLERRASKDEILELYLNDVYLGQRGSFAIHGVAEASRIFFGKDVANISIERSGADRRRDPEPGLALAVRQSEARRRAPQRRAAGDGGRELHHATTRPTRASREPLQVVARSVDNEAPYFVDMVGAAGGRGVSRA